MTGIQRALRASLAVTVLSVATVGSAVSPDDYAADVAGLWRIIADEYAYFDDKLVDWSRVADAYRPDVEAAGADPARQLQVLEAMLEELYDFHVTLNVFNDRSPVVIPQATDLWAELVDGHAVITAVRPGSPAAVAGVRLGDRVMSVDGHAVLDAVEW